MFLKGGWETWEWEKSSRVGERKNCKIIYERAKWLLINEESL